MRGRITILSACCAVCLLSADLAAAQMFGPRQLGGTLSRRAAPGLSSVGTLTGGERFVRGNRRVGDFVGTDTSDLDVFVGARQSQRGRQIRSAISGLREDSGPNVNQPMSAAPKTSMGIYQPRIRIGFDYVPRPPTEVESVLSRRLTDRLGGEDGSGPIAVTLDGRTAILRGEVVSQRDAVLAEAIARMEPGVSDVRNDLTLVPTASQSDPPAPGIPPPLSTP